MASDTLERPIEEIADRRRTPDQPAEDAEAHDPAFIHLHLPRWRAWLILEQLEREAYGDHDGGHAVRSFLRELSAKLES